MQSKMSHSEKILLGAVLGGIAIGSTALFLSSKKGKELTQNSKEKLHQISGKIEDLIEATADKTQNIADGIEEKTKEYSNKVHDFAMEISEHLKDAGSEDNKERLRNLLIGGVLGSVLGAGVASMASAEGNHNEDVFQKLGLDADNIKTLLNELGKRLDPNKQAVKECARIKTNVTKDVIDFVSSGIQLWQDIQKK